MKPDKQIKKYKAAKGHMLPLFYKGSIIRIDENKAIEIDLSALLYEPKHQLLKAIALKNIIEIGEE